VSTITTLFLTDANRHTECTQFNDPAKEAVVFVFLLSKTGNSIAIWRRRIALPPDLVRQYANEIAAAKSTMKHASIRAAEYALRHLLDILLLSLAQKPTATPAASSHPRDPAACGCSACRRKGHKAGQEAEGSQQQAEEAVVAVLEEEEQGRCCCGVRVDVVCIWLGLSRLFSCFAMLCFFGTHNILLLCLVYSSCRSPQH
jgi:hypothetical protein